MVVIIDFHCHILPGLDDGARNWDESIEMARSLVSQGVTGVVATPHWLKGYFTPTVNEILDAVGQLEQRLSKADINLKIYPGCEAYLEPDLTELVREGRVLTINNGGRYLLVEFPFQELPGYTEDVLFRLKVNGITPIIAHPERNGELANDTTILINMVRMGCLTQINAGSFLGLYGRNAEKAVNTWLRQKVVHFLGSDLHCNGERVVNIGKVKTNLKNKVNIEELQRIMYISAEEVLAGEQVGIQNLGDQDNGILKKLVGRIF